MGWWEQRASLIWHLPGRVWAAMLASGPLSLWLTAGAAMAWTLISVGYVVAFRPDLTPGQLFLIVLTAHCLVLVALVALIGAELSLRFGKGGVSLDVGGRGDHPQSAVVTTRTEVTAGAGGGGEGDDGELPESERIR